MVEEYSGSEELRPLETQQEAASRLMRELQITPVGPDEPENKDAALFRMALRKQPDGTYTGMYASVLAPEYFDVLPPAAKHEEQFNAAKELLSHDPALLKILTYADGRWWQYHPQLEPAVEQRLKEVYEASYGEDKLDVLNCSSESLSTEEATSILYALKCVAAMTGGKAFNRMNGLILVDEADLPTVSENNIGFYNTPAGILGVNMTYIRRTARALEERYKNYFDGMDHVDGLAVTIAHEFGHVMDIQTLEEAEKFGIRKDDVWWSGWGNMTTSFSYFQEGLGWSSKIDTEGDQNQTNWTFDNPLHIEEEPPTDYAYKSPQEDFAETFAILALGGKTNLVSRKNIIRNSFANTGGDSQVGPQQVEFIKLDPSALYSPRGKLKGHLKLQVGLSKA